MACFVFLAAAMTVSECSGQDRFGNFGNRPITHPSPEPQLERYRVRIVWGGGAATAWQGNLVMSGGRFENITALGLEPDTGASLNAAGNEIQIRPVRAADFSGFDVEIVGSQSNELLLTLLAPELGVGIERRVVDLTPLLKSAEETQSIQFKLDESGNRLDINRAPGDQLPVTTSRSHLVFDPGEVFEFDLHPFRGTKESNANSKLQVELFPSGETRAEFNESYSLNTNGQTFATTQPIRLNVPEQEGVYDLRVTLRDDSLATRLSFNRKRLSRTIQIIVIDPEKEGATKLPEEIVLWSEIYNSRDPRNPWIDRIPGVPQIRMASSGSSADKLRNDGVAATVIDGKTWNRFAPGGWQAIPLQVKEPGKPHIIDIEFLDDGPMAVGLSVLQPNGAGQIEPFGVDSGISIPRGQSPNESTIRRHRIFFWPHHEKPYLLFANRHADRPAMIGAVRVLAGPDRLAKTEPEGANIDVGFETSRRQFVSFYEKPLFAENFSAQKAFHPDTGQTWHDWNTFLTGADRWTQYLKANGYTSAMIVVAGDGSSLYPSSLIQPNPRYDSGAFSRGGADPVRKDVVEMLLRIFKRDGLSLIPVFHFNAPLPALERQRLTGSPDAEGITLLDLQGDTRIATLRDSASSVSIYNPLDRRVQTAYSDVLREFMSRYASHHQTMGGVGFVYSQDSVQVLPGQAWGVDRFTLKRFQQEAGLEAGSSPDWFAQLLSTENRASWLAWRQAQTVNWLKEQQQICSPLGRTFILGSDLLKTQDAFSALAPSLRRNSDMADALARIGVPFEQIANDPNTVFLQPAERSPDNSLAQNRLNIQLKQDGEGTRLFRDFANHGMLFSHRYSWAEFDQLRNRRLFGTPQQQSVMRLQPLSAVADWNRQRLARSIADFDSQTLVEGGWLSSFGQEEHLVPLVEVFTQIPDVRFAEVPVNEATEPQVGLVVRQATVENQNWFYAVNPTPWKLSCRIQLSGRNTVLESFGGEWKFSESEQPEVVVHLEPFSLQAGFTDTTVSVTGYQVDVPEEVISELQDRLNSLLPKVSRAAQADPLLVLENPGFEPVGQTGDAPRQFGWSYDNRTSDAVTLKQQGAQEGQTALSMASQGAPTWIRSNKFDAPETGRLSVSVMLRSDHPESQPPLRISVLGDDGRHVYYRYGSVSGQSRQITDQWQEFAVHFDDLPLNGQGSLQIGFDLMGAGQADIDQVRVFDRWLDAQDGRALTQFLATARYHLNNKSNVDRCQRMLDSYWPRFLEEFFPDESEEAEVAEETTENRSESSSQMPANPGETSAPKR